MNLIGTDGQVRSIAGGNPPQYEAFKTRETYDTASPRDLKSFGPTKTVPLGDVALARSGDKGANLNCGIFVRDAEAYGWLRTYLSRQRMKELLGKDWHDSFVVERVEFPRVLAVHFVIYGILGRGVSSSTRLDSLGKGFADFLRDKWVDVPEKFLP